MRGVDLMFAEIKRTLADFGVVFDVYFSERTLHETGALDKAIEGWETRITTGQGLAAGLPS